MKVGLSHGWRDSQWNKLTRVDTIKIKSSWKGLELGTNNGLCS